MDRNLDIRIDEINKYTNFFLDTYDDILQFQFKK